MKHLFVVPLVVAGICLASASALAGDPAQPPAPTPDATAATPAAASPSAPETPPIGAAPETKAPAAVAASPAPPQSNEPSKIMLSTAPAEPPKCEPCETDKDAAEGAGALVVGPGLFDLSSLNDHLTANGYERLASVMTILGGEGHAVFASGFVAGARGGALLGPSANGPNVRAHLSGGFGMLDFGFAPVRTTHVLFAFTGGIGGYGLSLGIGDDQSTPFDSLLRNPKHSVSVGQGGLLVGLTLDLDFRVPTGDVEHGRRGFFTLGARVAGLYGPPLGGWDISEGDKATDGPRTGLTGGYAALAIGFGGGSMRARNGASSSTPEERNR